MKIYELVDGQKVDLKVLVSNVNKGISNNNSAYLNITLQDSTGTIEAKKWDANLEDIEFFTIGKIIHVIGDANKYRNAMQIKILKAEEIQKEEIDYQDYVISAPIARQTLEVELKTYIESIKNNDIKNIVSTLIKKHYSAFISHPAATRNHHEYCSGLLYHSISMAHLADLFASYYENIDRDILIGACLIHDLGKVIELSGPIIPTYTTEGRLIGHISILQAEVREVSHQLNITGEIPMLLEHMILSHHGKREFGSPVLPMTKEALLLNYIDDLDAKINILDKALESTEEGSFTNKIYPLEERAFYKPHKR